MAQNNPYTTGHPAKTDDSFFGRQEYLQWVESHYLGDRPAAHLEVWGPKRMGKSSVLHRLRNYVLAHRPKSVCVYWSSESLLPGDPNRFYAGLADKLHHECQTRGFALPEVPASAPADTLFSIYHRHLAKEGVWVFLFIDEFLGFIEKCKLNADQLTWLRSHTQTEWNPVCLVLSTQRPLSELPTNLYTSGLPGIFDHNRKCLGPLDEKAAIAAVCEPAKNAGLTLPAGTAEKLYAMCGGHPHLTTGCASVIADALIRGQAVDPASPALFEQLFKTSTDFLRRLLNPILGDENNREDIGRFVLRSFTQTYKSEADLTPAAEELHRAGLCVYDAGTKRIKPVGGLVAEYLQKQLQPGDAPASEEARDEFFELVRGVESGLRSYVHQQMLKQVGANWADMSKYFPSDFPRRDPTAPAVENLTLGQLMELANRIPKPDPEFKTALERCRRTKVSQHRGKITHGADFPFTASELRDAQYAVQMLQTFFSRNGVH